MKRAITKRTIEVEKTHASRKIDELQQKIENLKNQINEYDWMVYAQNHPDFKKEIEEAIESGEERKLTSRQIHRIRFEPERQSVVVTPFSDHSDWCVKIIPKRITYRAVLQAINGDWEFSEADISDVD